MKKIIRNEVEFTIEVKNNSVYVKTENMKNSVSAVKKTIKDGNIVLLAKLILPNGKEVPGLKFDEEISSIIEEIKVENKATIDAFFNNIDFRKVKLFEHDGRYFISEAKCEELDRDYYAKLEKEFLTNFNKNEELAKDGNGLVYISHYTLSEKSEKTKVAEKNEELAKAEKFEAQKQEAKATNTNVLIKKYSVDCNDQDEHCDIDIIEIYITPEGKIIKKREHTW